MADRRMISGEIWQDEFVGSQDFFGRILWVGIITTCADDQGRFPANMSIIRAKVFLYDDSVTCDSIRAGLMQFVEAGKLFLYTDDKGREIFQLVNWWRYQSPQWPQPSKYAAPKGWTDRVRYHGVGRQIITENWSANGGFIKSLPRGQGSGLPYTIEDEESRVEDGDDEGKGRQPTPAAAGGYRDDYSEAFDLYNKVTGFMAFTGSDPGGLQTKLNAVVKKYGTVEAAAEWCTNAYAESLKRKTKDGRFYSKNNLAWVDWAIVGEIPPEVVPAPPVKPNGKRELTPEEWQAEMDKQYPKFSARTA